MDSLNQRSAIACLYFAQLAVFGYQALKLRQTVDAAAKQSDDMQRSIAEATRAANAMEKSANAATIGSQAASENVLRISHQMGAYLSGSGPRGAQKSMELTMRERCIKVALKHPSLQVTGARFPAPTSPFPTPPKR